MVRIEAMTAGALRRGGLDHVSMHMLLRDAMRGRSRARRALERAAGAELEVVARRSRERCPLRYAMLSREFDDGVLACRVDLRPGLWWDHDTLHGELPETMMLAIPGQAVGRVLQHPDIDPALTAVPPRERGGILSVDAEPVGAPRVEAVEAIRHLRRRMALLLEEARMDQPVPKGYRTVFDLMALGTVVLAAIVLSLPHDGVGGVVTTTMACLAAVYAVHNAINARRRRPYSMLQTMMSEARHQGMLEDLKTRRKR